MTKEEFYDSIDADTEFSFEFCRKLYGYSLYDPPFADKVIDKFRLIYGRDKVRYIYSFFLYWQIQAEDEEIKPAARELRERWERDNERRKRECRNLNSSSYQTMTDQELLKNWKNRTLAALQ